jgi:hypothetical protein
VTTCRLTRSEILTRINSGLPDGTRYSKDPKAERAAWKVVVKVAGKSEEDAKAIVKAWVKDGVLIDGECENPSTRKMVRGLYLAPAKRPA